MGWVSTFGVCNIVSVKVLDAAPSTSLRQGLLVLGHSWIMEVSKSNQTPATIEDFNDNLGNETINTLLLRRFFLKESLSSPKCSPLSVTSVFSLYVFLVWSINHLDSEGSIDAITDF